MSDYQRSYPLLSACGLNCGLCPRFYADGSSRCPGCGGKGFFSTRPSCSIVSCTRRRGIEFCCECGEYPCKKLDGAECVDSFITHRNMKTDFEKVRSKGLDAYRAELTQKIEILENLLENYNDGWKKSFYCLAVNLLALPDLKSAMAKIESQTPPDADVKQKAARAAAALNELGAERGIELVLNKKKP